jgi:hypothetical protein
LSGLKVWKEIPDNTNWYQSARIATEISPELLELATSSVRASLLSSSGGIVAALVLTLLIKFLSRTSGSIFPAAAGELIGTMSAGGLHR